MFLHLISFTYILYHCRPSPHFGKKPLAYFLYIFSILPPAGWRSFIQSYFAKTLPRSFFVLVTVFFTPFRVRARVNVKVWDAKIIGLRPKDLYRLPRTLAWVTEETHNGPDWSNFDYEPSNWMVIGWHMYILDGDWTDVNSCRMSAVNYLYCTDWPGIYQIV